MGKFWEYVAFTCLRHIEMNFRRKHILILDSNWAWRQLQQDRL